MKAKIKAILLMTLLVVSTCGYLLYDIYRGDPTDYGTLSDEYFSQKMPKPEIIAPVQAQAHKQSGRKVRTNDKDILPRILDKEISSMEINNNSIATANRTSSSLGYSMENGAKIRKEREVNSNNTLITMLYPQSGNRTMIAGNSATNNSGMAIGNGNKGNNSGNSSALLNGGNNGDDPYDGEGPPPEGVPVGNGIILLLLFAVSYVIIRKYTKEDI